MQGLLKKILFNNKLGWQRYLEPFTGTSLKSIRSMNDEHVKQLLRELKIIRLCAVVMTTVIVLAFLAHILNFHL
jgi:hypothetical protein